MNVIDQILPGLSDALLKLPRDRQVEIYTSACRLADFTAESVGEDAYSLVEAMLERRLNPEEAEAARQLSEAADETYFSLQEAGEAEAVWSHWFFKSRLLQSLWHANGDTAEDAVLHALYELFHTSDDRSRIVESVATELDL